VKSGTSPTFSPRCYTVPERPFLDCVTNKPIDFLGRNFLSSPRPGPIHSTRVRIEASGPSTVEPPARPEDFADAAQLHQAGDLDRAEAA
jgi:hypothetical protein